FGLAYDANTGDLWWSGGGDERIHRHTLHDQRFTAHKSPEPIAAGGGFKTGVFFDVNAGTLYSLGILRKGGNKSFAWGDADDTDDGGGLIAAIPFAGGEAKLAQCGLRPYDVVRARNGLLYV